MLAMTAVVAVPCRLCDTVHDLTVNVEGFVNWQAGELIQVAMPRLDADGREFIKTGITAEEWEEIFPPEEDE